MTQSGVRRMLALESVLSALKALLYGIPAGLLATYLVFLALTQRDGFPFSISWGTLVQATLGVFVIALITTQYAAAKLRGGSIMEGIRAHRGRVDKPNAVSPMAAQAPNIDQHPVQPPAVPVRRVVCFPCFSDVSKKISLDKPINT